MMKLLNRSEAWLRREEKVRAILLADPSESNASIAERLGVSKSHVALVRSGKRHTSMAPELPRRVGRTGEQYNLAEIDAKQIPTKHQLRSWYCYDCRFYSGDEQRPCDLGLNTRNRVTTAASCGTFWLADK